jgi:hypothetical protein
VRSYSLPNHPTPLLPLDLVRAYSLHNPPTPSHPLDLVRAYVRGPALQGSAPRERIAVFFAFRDYPQHHWDPESLKDSVCKQHMAVLGRGTKTVHGSLTPSTCVCATHGRFGTWYVCCTWQLRDRVRVLHMTAYVRGKT